MRLEPGLRFDPGCDSQLCEDFDPIVPSETCLMSCRNLFVPRLMPGDPPLRPASGVCDGLTFLKCYARLDYDFGAGTPVKVNLVDRPSVFVQPGKDGSVYLIDAGHLGTLYDRETIVDICGAPNDDCSRDQWRGMIITQPTVTEVDRVPVVLVPTFMFDTTHPAGLVALKILVEDGVPKLEPFWQAPDFMSLEAIKRFRYYPSRAVLWTPNPEESAYAWVIDVVDKGKSVWRRPLQVFKDWRLGRDRGTILGVQVRDGHIVARIPMSGRGRRYVLPIVYGESLYVPSKPGLEIHRLPSIR